MDAEKESCFGFVCGGVSFFAEIFGDFVDAGAHEDLGSIVAVSEAFDVAGGDSRGQHVLVCCFGDDDGAGSPRVDDPGVGACQSEGKTGEEEDEVAHQEDNGADEDESGG